MSREIVKFNFFSFLKYSKNKDTKKTDFTKPPSIRAKVPHYDNKWAVEIYDTKSNLIFPCDNEHVTPMDLIPKLSSVACVLQCGGLWIGGKGWGLTWKLIQCVVKPKEVVSVYGKCHIQLSPEEKETIDSQQINEDVADENSVSDYIAPNVVAVPKAIAAPAPVVNTHVEDSDGEDNDSAVAPAPVAPAPMKKIVKKVSEIAATPPPAPVTEPVAETAAPTIVKKKVVKKVT
jgi:hypothetical protein